MLFSCNNIETVEDKYTDIPQFPEFKNGELKLVKKIELIAKTDSAIKYQENYYMHERFIVKDSTFFFITFLTDSYDPYTPNLNDKYYINLITIKNGKIDQRNWIDNDFKINFDIDKNNDDLTIGKRKYFAKSNYLKYDSISNFNDYKLVDTVFYEDYYNNNCFHDNNFYYPDSFDKIIIDSKAKSTAEANHLISIFTWKYDPVYLNYYKIKHKNKIGLTKVTGNIEPIFIKLKDELYYIEEKHVKINAKKRTEKIIVYKIQ